MKTNFRKFLEILGTGAFPPSQGTPPLLKPFKPTRHTKGEKSPTTLPPFLDIGTDNMRQQLTRGSATGPNFPFRGGYVIVDLEKESNKNENSKTNYPKSPPPLTMV